MTKKSFKFKLLLFASGVILVGTIGYFVVRNLTKKKEDNRNKPPLISGGQDNEEEYESIFPSLTPSFVSQIRRFDESGRDILDQELANRLFKSILSRVNKFDGEIFFDYNINHSNRSITLYFKVMKGNDLIEAKSYDISF